ncbi:hypothetical protein ABG067_002473 [Albugo candida]
MDELAQNVANLRICAESSAHQKQDKPFGNSENDSLETTLYVSYKSQVERALTIVEEQDQICYQIMQFTTAKGVKNAMYHSLFNQVSSGKLTVLQKWFQTGVLPTRDGLKHWFFDARNLRNTSGSTLLHVACDVSMTRACAKISVVKFLLDKVGFDVNVRDLLGRTPLHVAGLNGYKELVQCLLERGADAMLQDRSGLRPLALVNTLSRPHEEIVTVLTIQQARKPGSLALTVSKEQAKASAAFLRFLSSYIIEDCRSKVEMQVSGLIEHLKSTSTTIYFDELLVRYIPILFKETTNCSQVIDMMTPDTFKDPIFISELRTESFAHHISLVTSHITNTISNSLWVGMLLHLAQRVRDQVGEFAQNKLNEDSAREYQIRSEASEHSVKTSTHPDSRTWLSSHPFRQLWHYAILFRAASKPFPSDVHVQNGESFIQCVRDVSELFPLDEFLLVGKNEYVACSYDSAKRVIVLDRPYEGESASSIRIYLRGSERLQHSYIAVKCIWEREPGNNYDDASREQEVFLDYQFLPPQSYHEVAAKVGPFDNVKAAREFAAVWRQQSRAAFMEKSCQSQTSTCKVACPQLKGSSPCTENMISIAKQLATKHLGRATFCQVQPARALVEKLQNGDLKV